MRALHKLVALAKISEGVFTINMALCSDKGRDPPIGKFLNELTIKWMHFLAQKTIEKYKFINKIKFLKRRGQENHSF